MAPPASGALTLRLRHADGHIICVKIEYTKTINPEDRGVALELIIQNAKDIWQKIDGSTVIANFAAMINNTNDYIYLKDRNHVFVATNQTFSIITDASKHWTDLIGKTDYEVFPEVLADAYYNLEKKAFASSQVEHECQEIHDKNGNQGWWDNHKYPIKDENGEIIGLFGIAHNITLAKRANEALVESNERLSLAMSASKLGVWDYNLETSKLEWDDFMFLLYDIERKDFKGTYDDWEKSLHPDDRIRCNHEIQDALSGEKDFNVKFRIACKNGKIRWVKASAKIFRDENGLVVRMLGTNIDITAEVDAISAQELASSIFESHESMIVTDANKIIIKVNEAFSAMTGYAPSEVIGKTPKVIGSGMQNKKFYNAMWKQINNNGKWEGEILNRRKSGETYPMKLAITAVKNYAGLVTNYVSVHSDISISKAAAESIKTLAFYDPLTQLPNRRLLLDELKNALATSARSGQRGALIFLDLDHFKTLNDTLGHSFGDLLLQQVALRLTASVRQNDTVARIGGDEFVILLTGLSGTLVEAAAQAKLVCEKIISAINEPYTLNTQVYRITPSLGITLFNGHEQVSEDLLMESDIAMYESKAQGRNTFRFFDPTMQEVINSRVKMEKKIRTALEQKQFELYYQVQVDSDNRPVGAEVLIRWIHPERGMISPADFIPFAEETGLIMPIGQWVVNAACLQLKAWQNMPIASALVLAVNVSAKQFHQQDFVEQVQIAIERHNINPALLKLELTESMLLHDIDDIIIKMGVLRDIGVRFSLDDFGTGYSSLQYLKKLPLTQLKIDQSFVRDISSDVSDRAIVRTIIVMAQSLDINVIAEGVETIEQRQYLFDNGCFYYQGYLFSKPLSIDSFEALLNKKPLPFNI